MLNRINLILKAKNITSKQFAEEIGVQPSGLSHILSGRNNPSLDFVMKVIRRYPEIDIHWLMFGTGEMYEQHHIHPVTPSAPAPVAAKAPAPGELDLFSQMEEPAAQFAPAPVAPSPVAQPSVPAASQEKAPMVSDLTQTAAYNKNDNIIEPKTVGEPVQKQNIFSTENTKPITENQSSEIPTGNEASSAKNTSEQSAENRENENRPTHVPEFPVASSHKKIVKMIVLYDDKSFSEYYPE